MTVTTDLDTNNKHTLSGYRGNIEVKWGNTASSHPYVTLLLNDGNGQNIKQVD